VRSTEVEAANRLYRARSIASANLDSPVTSSNRQLSMMFAMVAQVSP